MGQSGLRSRSRAKEDDGDVAKRQVDDDGDNKKPIYELVNMKNGGGKLIDLIKSNGSSYQSSGSFTLTKSLDLVAAQSTVDKQIRELVEPLLYNGGRGKLVPLGQIWMHRFGKWEVTTEDDGSMDPEASSHPVISDSSEAGANSNYRWVCWKLEERGFGGETALHICFLLSTQTHMILAQKLLTMFPMLINDIYTCDEYFGESSLHMAIVNENVRIVKLLLDHGANVHERCLGSFFLPGDQIDQANSTVRKICDKIKSRGLQERTSLLETQFEGLDLSSNQFKSLRTNYDGYVYWGEYPLSFATCLGLADCYKLLLAKGANPNKQDSNGNATLHMAVISDRINMFDLCYMSGANLNIRNKQNLSPLTLAAKLKRVEMFFHILKIQRRVDWIFCSVGFVAVPLIGVDSINIKDGSCDDDSVLSIVVFGGSNEHLFMLNGLLGQLLKIKWTTSARRKFFLWMLEFIMFLGISLIAYTTRFYKPSELLASSQVDLYAFDDYRTINLYSECALVFYVIRYLWVTIKRIIKSVGPTAFFKTLAQAPEVSMFTLTCLLILSCIPLRLVQWQQAEDFLVALIVFVSPLKLLFFCRASKQVGSFVVMIYKIVVNDVLCFVVFLIIFVAGFSQSFLIIFKTHRASRSRSNATNVDNNHFNNLFDGIISMHMMALNEFTTVFDEFEATDYPELSKLLFCVYMLIASILLINMLIAMLGKTYQDIASQPNESLRQWARALLIVERMWTKRERFETLDRYSRERSQAEGGGRYYGTTWALSSQDREEISLIDEMTQDNRRNAKRLGRLDDNNCHQGPEIYL